MLCCMQNLVPCNFPGFEYSVKDICMWSSIKELAEQTLKAARHARKLGTSSRYVSCVFPACHQGSMQAFCYHFFGEGKPKQD